MIAKVDYVEVYVEVDVEKLGITYYGPSTEYQLGYPVGI
jgi:hypothetical protein